ncbi:FGGY-family carbohydrate kinase [Candidatus Poribacteria bacterium]
MDMLLGLDVGTTASKALLLSVEGEVITSASHGHGLITPREGWVEQDPEDLWLGVIAVCRAVLENVKPQDRVLALSLSSQAGTTIPVDATGQPLRNAISWMDHRARSQSEHVRNTVGAGKIYEISGWRLGNGLPLLHISWLRECEPDTFSSARHFLFVNDFIIHRLTGQLCMNPSDAGITQLYNIAQGQWDHDMLEIAGIEPDQLSPMRNSGTVVGHVTEQASRETGLPTSTLVVNGAHDQYCAAVGAGVLKQGDIMLSCGTAWVILCLIEHLRLDSEKRLSISRHAIPGKWGALRSLGGVGASLEWLLDNLWASGGGDRSDLYDELNRRVSNVPPGSRGMLCFPSSGAHGRGSRGGFIGLTLSHSLDDMARAVMEGITFELRWTLEDIRDSGISPGKLRMVGGAARSSIWSKIVADVTNVPVVIPSTTEAAGCGAAILAGVGSKVFADPESGYQALSGHETILESDKKNVEVYDELFGIYRTASQQLQDPLSRLSEFGDSHSTSIT